MSRHHRYPSADTLLDEASDATGGLGEFGPGDFREGLEVLLASLAEDADLHPDTDETVIATLRGRLVNRLLVEDWYRRHPEIEDIAVEGPLDVIGLPRTGTTALASMLSLDEGFRSLRMWEQRNPVPPPTSEGEENDARRVAYAAENAALPAELKAMHLYEVDATVEDSDILGMAFHGQQYTMPVYGYHAWWRDSDNADTFAYHRRVMKLLASQRPPHRWLFKAPHHKFHLEAIVAAYPDARFVMTHRDPAKSIPSYASFVLNYFPAARVGHDLGRLGPEVCEHMRIGMTNAIAARARIGEDRFFDVHHTALVADPMATVRQVYDFIGCELAPEVERVMGEWYQRNRSGAHGTHRYTPEQFGLSAGQIRDDFGFYLDRFGVEVA